MNNLKKIFSILLIVLLTISLVACNTNKKSTNNNNLTEKENNINSKIEEENNINNKTEEENQVEEPTPTTSSEKKEVVLYFVNNKYIDTGDENLEKLIPEKRIIEYGDISLEEAIVKELMKGPENDNLSTLIPTNVKLLGVEVSDNTAFVNFAQEGLHGGSMQEIFTIDQIVGSLLELDNVKKVQFLIDGEKAESLMGHLDTSEPFESFQH